MLRLTTPFSVSFIFVLAVSIFSSNVSAHSRSFEQLLSDKYGPALARDISELLKKQTYFIEVDDGQKNFGKTGIWQFEEEDTLFAIIADQAQKRSSNLRALCLACGNGEQALRMALLGADVEAYDIMPHVIEQAIKNFQEFRTRFPTLKLNVTYGVTDLSSQEASNIFAIATFDFITAKYFYHFLTPAQQRIITSRVHDALKRGGHFFLIAQGPYLQREVLDTLISRIASSPGQIDYGYYLIHQSPLTTRECDKRKSYAREIGIASIWCHYYDLTPLDGELTVSMGKNIDGVRPGVLFPSSFLEKVVLSKTIHYPYNMATIEGIRNLFKQNSLAVKELRHIDRMLTIDEEIFPNTSSLQEIGHERQLVNAVSIYAHAVKQ